VTNSSASNAGIHAIAMKPIFITSFHDQLAAAMSHQI
jgi:AmiR/NasT family two-component response regulator